MAKKKPAVPRWTINHFSQANPNGKRKGDVAALLRRVAKTIEASAR